MLLPNHVRKQKVTYNLPDPQPWQNQPYVTAVIIFSWIFFAMNLIRVKTWHFCLSVRRLRHWQLLHLITAVYHWSENQRATHAYPCDKTRYYTRSAWLHWVNVSHPAFCKALCVDASLLDVPCWMGHSDSTIPRVRRGLSVHTIFKIYEVDSSDLVPWVYFHWWVVVVFFVCWVFFQQWKSLIKSTQIDVKQNLEPVVLTVLVSKRIQRYFILKKKPCIKTCRAKTQPFIEKHGFVQHIFFRVTTKALFYTGQGPSVHNPARGGSRMRWEAGKEGLTLSVENQNIAKGWN